MPSVTIPHIAIKNLDMADYIRPLFRHKSFTNQDMADYEILSNPTGHHPDRLEHSVLTIFIEGKSYRAQDHVEI